MAFNRKYATPMAVATAMAVVSLATPLAFAQQADASGEVRRV
ncbi:RND transporter, partial [Achromobacter ruhlandii]